MKNRLQKMMKNEKGLTLVELLAVIVILGIIAAIAIPAIGGIIQSTREKAVIADALNTMAAAELYFIDNNTAENSTVVLGVTSGKVTGELLGYLDSPGSLTSATVTKIAGGNKIVFAGSVGKTAFTDTVAKTKKELTELDKDGIKGLITP